MKSKIYYKVLQITLFHYTRTIFFYRHTDLDPQNLKKYRFRSFRMMDSRTFQVKTQRGNGRTDSASKINPLMDTDSKMECRGHLHCRCRMRTCNAIIVQKRKPYYLVFVALAYNWLLPLLEMPGECFGMREPKECNINAVPLTLL